MLLVPERFGFVLKCLLEMSQVNDGSKTFPDLGVSDSLPLIEPLETNLYKVVKQLRKLFVERREYFDI